MRRLLPGRRLAIAGIAAATLMSLTSGLAGAAGSGDASCDTLDPFLASSNAQPGAPNCSTTTNGKYVNSPAADITGFSLTDGGTNQVNVSISVAGTLPTPGTLATNALNGVAYPGFTGVSARVLFNNPRTQNNRTVPACQRFEDPSRPILHYQGHYLDDWQYFIGADLTIKNGVWALHPSIGWYDPGADGGYTFFDLEADPNTAGATSSSVSGNTINVSVPTFFVQNAGGTCFGSSLGALNGKELWDFARDGDNLINLKAMSYLNQTTSSPVVVDLTAAGQGKIDNIGGFIYPIDWTGSSYDIGLLVNLPDNFSAQNLGPGCPTPTFGGLLPSSPLFTPGSPCQVNDPVGPSFIATTISQSV